MNLVKASDQHAAYGESYEFKFITDTTIQQLHFRQV